MYYRNECGKRSQFIAFLGALVGGVGSGMAGCFLGALCFADATEGMKGGGGEGLPIFLAMVGVGSIVGVWLGQVIGCGLLLRLCRYDLAGLTSLLLLGFAPIGVVFSAVALSLFVLLHWDQGPWAPWGLVCFVPMLWMPWFARSLALARQQRRWAKATCHFYDPTNGSFAH